MSSLPRPYRFHVGANWAGKPPEPQTRRFKTKPFPPESEIGHWRDEIMSKYHSSTGTHIGEDFFYVQDMRNESGISFGVADGVGGWVDSGVDPSLFSQALMYHAHRYSKNAWAGEPETDPTQDYEEREQVEGWEMTPAECLELAYGAVLRERYVQAGSSTACLLTLNASSGILRAANLGDSGFAIFRSSSVIHQQPVQQHFFNCPKQLSKLPTSIPRFSRACVDSPRDADIYETKLRDGDLIIAYTDGLSDNVFPAEIIKICSLISRRFNIGPKASQPRHTDGDEPEGEQVVKESSEDQLVQTVAERLVDYARGCMANKTRVSPFERAAAREGMYFRGGKVDDVTVIVALVRETL
ncbi:protein serine/threonine phosphatase 2C [Laetiporus sulphureus 93-53]|uniref:Protein phosphatase n=1 Tax=Laetiporus sulphureus 93-53 TaxID=1314785 RepID=A0A165H7N2_9APHY|nr:protein serine/threonine phosphatase 2C [Laetiporus sulphureus 93-53]KZT11357.1 protein serine/threonine phosphatase 2C [Laetiporus sulphureus 93-53]